MGTRNSKVDILITALSEMSQARRPWISRKEVAAWSAAVLYFGFLFAISNALGGENSTIPLIFAVLLVAAALFLFVTFIHAQFGSYACEAATQEVLNRVVLELINCEDIPKDLLGWSTDNIALPDSLRNRIHDETNRVRGGNFFKRLFVPLKFAVSRKSTKSEIHKLELEEAAIYDLMTIMSVAVILTHFVFSK